MSGMKRAKTVKMWTELGDERPRLGDFEDYINRPMGCGPYGIIRAWDVFEYLTRGEYWWMYLRAFRRDCSHRVARLKAAEMRYKAAAKKLKQVVELADPTPADVVLPHGAPEHREEVKRDYGADEVEGCRADGTGGAAEGRGEAEVPELAVVRARAIWSEIVEGIGQSATALMMRLDALTDPGRVEDANMLAAWREKYANEITERTKKRWWRRLLRAVRERSEEESPKRKKVA